MRSLRSTRVIVFLLPLFYVISFAQGPTILLYQKTGAEPYAQLGSSVATAGDVNGDGINDFIIGAADYNEFFVVREGSAYLYSGADGSLIYEMNGAALRDKFGYSVSSVRDVNGDGRADFIIGAPDADPDGLDGSGSAYIYSGADGSLLFQKNGTVTNKALGTSVAGAEDVNGDGRSDFIVSAVGRLGVTPSVYVYSGVDGSLLYQKDGIAGESFGASVASAGDVNGDGRADFIIGAPRTSPNGVMWAGSAYVFSGLDGSLLYQIHGDSWNAELGWSVATAGDINNDGKSDFLIGAPSAGAYLYSGADGGLIYQKGPGDALGISVASAGDVNGDGRVDFIIGEGLADPNNVTGAGSAHIYSGVDGSELFQLDGHMVDQHFGWSVSTVGDVNGDGRAEFIIGAPLGAAGGEGSAYVYGWDIVAPTISCPPDTVVSSFSGQCNRFVTFTANASDNLPGVSVDCTPPSGSIFSVGSTSVTCIATDVSGNLDTCDFEIIVTASKGDINNDSNFSPADVVLMLNCVFLTTGNCGFCFTDLDCDSTLSPSDVVLILNFVFLTIPLPC